MDWVGRVSASQRGGGLELAAHAFDYADSIGKVQEEPKCTSR